jgi:hypothetical protein
MGAQTAQKPFPSQSLITHDARSDVRTKKMIAMCDDEQNVFVRLDVHATDRTSATERVRRKVKKLK